MTSSTSGRVGKRLLAINTGSTALLCIVNAAVQLWLLQYLLKRLDLAEFIVLPVVMGLVYFIPMLTIVLTSGLGRYIFEAVQRKEPERISAITTNIMNIELVIATGPISQRVSAASSTWTSMDQVYLLSIPGMVPAAQIEKYLNETPGT